MESILKEGETCWRIAKADRLSIIIDAADFFRHAKSAMTKAKRSIYLIGWDFDTRIDLIPGNGDDKGNGKDGWPDQLGKFLNALAERNDQVDIRILKWDIGLINSITRGETPFYILKWIFDKRIHLKLDGAHPSISSHHMKLLVIDDEVAFCGGIDMTVGRWDTRDHTEKEPLRKSPMGFAQDPWHDATTCLSGEAAKALGEVARRRWKLATDEELPAPPPAGDDTPWPEGLEVGFRDISIGIARTAPEYKEREQIAEIETAKLAIIAATKKTLYVESQYFASRRIATAMAERLKEPDGPEIVLINPEGCEGYLEAKAMDSARIRLMKLVQDADIHNRFRLYYPVNEARTPIYVHAKMMFADDRIVKIGSANLNNRSMGYDTECDVILEAEEGQDELRAKIIATRDDLLAEHLGCKPEEVAQAIADHGGSIIGAIEALNRDTGSGLVPVPMRELTADEELIAETDIADPERPSGVRYRTSHFLKRRFGHKVKRAI